MAELILGTAQFGTKYGVTNNVGRLAGDAVTGIAKAFLNAGFDTFDTAPDYGDAQDRLGQLVTPLADVNYVSKYALDDEGAKGVKPSLVSTLQSLRVETLSGLMLHRVQDLRDRRMAEVWSNILAAKADGLLARAGASLYDVDDLLLALETLPGIDLIQIPGNLLDRKLLEHDAVQRFHDRGGAVHVRSAYLQGLLLLEAFEVPENFRELEPALQAIDNFALNTQMSKVEVALGFLKNHPVVDAVVVGALSDDEIGLTINAWRNSSPVELELPKVPSRILDPRRWG